MGVCQVEAYSPKALIKLHHAVAYIYILQCYFQLSPGDPPPESQIPPRKTPKIQKILKNASNLPPRYVFPPEPRV